MPDYLLPCTCGTKTPVSTAQAGETIRCTCGAALQVPTMRALRTLEQAVAVGAHARRPATRAWEDRHRVAFLLVLGSCVCLGVAGYLWATLPAKFVPPTDQEIVRAIQTGTAAQAMQVYSDMANGLGEPAGSYADDKTRTIRLWGISVAVILGGALQAGAWLVGRRTAGKP